MAFVGDGLGATHVGCGEVRLLQFVQHCQYLPMLAKSFNADGSALPRALLLMRRGISDDGRLWLPNCGHLAVTARNKHHVADATCAPQASMRFQRLRVQDVVSDNKAVARSTDTAAPHTRYAICTRHPLAQPRRNVLWRECNTKWKKTRPSGDAVLHSVGAVWIQGVSARVGEP